MLSHGQIIDSLKLGLPSNEVICDLTTQGFKLSTASPNTQDLLGYLDGELVNVRVKSTPISKLVYEISVTKLRVSLTVAQESYEAEKKFLTGLYGVSNEKKSLLLDKVVFEANWSGVKLNLLSSKYDVYEVIITYKHPVLGFMIEGNSERGF
jgi:hypothetical protein